MRKLKFIDLAAQQKHILPRINSRIKAVMRHGQYIFGPEIKTLEAKLAKFVGVKHCICVSSGTDALLISLMAKGIGVGDEVITTPFSFIATAQVIVHLGGIPKFVDIQEDTFNIDPAKIEENISNKTKAVIVVSLFGQCADMDPILKLCKKNDLTLIEDAAQSFGSTYKGRKSCSMAEISCTSFFPAKPLGTYGDGGACFTNDDELAEKMRSMINHGQNGVSEYVLPGVNARMDTIQAAILLEKLAIFPAELKKRNKIANRYSEFLKNKVVTPFISEHNQSTYAQYTIKSDSRQLIVEELNKKNIPNSIYYSTPLHLQPTIRSKNKNKIEYPIVSKVSKQVLSLPMHPYLSRADQDYIIKTIQNAPV